MSDLMLSKSKWSFAPHLHEVNKWDLGHCAVVAACPYVFETVLDRDQAQISMRPTGNYMFVQFAIRFAELTDA
jgi:hypothetical protein